LAPTQTIWKRQQVCFRYSIGDLCLFRTTFAGLVYRCPFDAASRPGLDWRELPRHLSGGADCVVLRDLRANRPPPGLRTFENGLLYVLPHSPDYFIDLLGTFEDYLRSFSPKSRQTVVRKVRRFARAGGGQADFRVYASPSELGRFHGLARSVAVKTYQERLFQGGLPDTAEFRAEMLELAAANQVRGFLLFQAGRPVAYLYVPIVERVGECAHLGYDPAAAEHSPGTVLLYLAIRHLFAERICTHLELGYGENQYKRVFCTGQCLRTDVYFFRPSAANWVALAGHAAAGALTRAGARALSRVGLRRRIKRLLRSP
jgi:CelD/BcsL family acetyltransferase involved in cellulose biosynthesis